MRFKVVYTNFETERLILKNIETSDRDFIFKQFYDETINQYFEEPLTNIKGADEIILFYFQPESRTQHRWILVRKSDVVKMGTCGFHNWIQKEKSVDVGYDLKKEYWKNEYMQEAMRKIISFAKNRMDLKVINACIYIEDYNSIDLVEKLGFVNSGKTKYEIFRGKEYLHNIYSLYLLSYSQSC